MQISSSKQVLVLDRHSLVAFRHKIRPNSRFYFTSRTHHRWTARTLRRSELMYFVSGSASDFIFSTDTFKLSYTEKFQSVFLDQIHQITTGGFVPNKKGADPNFGKCLQCAAIDRARWKVNPIVERSPFCQQCFDQYCFNAGNVSSSSEIVGRKLNFVDPDPQGAARAEQFLSHNKAPLIVGLVAVVVIIIGSVFLM